VFILRLLGGASIVGDDGVLVTGAAVQRHRIAMLALLALAPDRGMGREKLLAYLWPERDSEHARNLLKQAVHVLRRTLGESAILTASDEVRLNRDFIQIDVADFEEALTQADREAAITIYRGPFLDGFFLSSAEEFGHWVERERDRLASAFGQALEALAEVADAAQDFPRAIERWKKRATLDPYDSRVALRLIEAHAASGNRAAAISHAAAHVRLLQQEFEIEPPVEIQALVLRLRHEEMVNPEPQAGATQPNQSEAPTENDSRLRLDASAAHTPAAALRTPPSAAASDRTASELAGANDGSGARSSLQLLRYGLLTALLGAALFTLIRYGRTGFLKLPTSQDTSATVVTRSLHGTQNVAARELYMRGSDPALMRTDSGTRQLLAYFRQAIALDSTYAAAYTGLANGYMRISMSGDGDDGSFAELQALAEAAALKAVALDDSLAEAHATLALVRMRGRDYRAAESEFRLAIALDPRNARIREKLAGLYLVTEQPAEGLAEAERALELDSLSAGTIAENARALLFNGRCDEALARLDKLSTVKPPLLRVGSVMAQCHALRRRWSHAIAVLRPQAEYDVSSLALLGYVLARAGQREEALRIHAQLLERWRARHVGAAPVAVVDAGLGDLGAAFERFERAIDDGSLTLQPAYGIIMEPVFDELQRDTRFLRLKQRLGLQTR
jgi:serine/threonine-protein kinase